MKYLFSITLLLSLNIYATTPFILITYSGEDRQRMKQIEDVMSNQFNFTSELYEVSYGECKKKRTHATHICIDDEYNVKVLDRNNRVMEDMLSVYWK